MAKPSPTTRRSIREAILADLIAAFPHPISTADLHLAHGSCAKSRIKELCSDDGWEIVSTECADNSPGYKLVKLEKGPPTKIKAGCVIRWDDSPSQPWRVTTHRDAIGNGAIPEAVLRGATEWAARAFWARLARDGYPPPPLPVFAAVAPPARPPKVKRATPPPIAPESPEPPNFIDQLSALRGES